MHPIVERAARGELPDWASASKKRRAHMSRVAGLMGKWAEQLTPGDAKVARGGTVEINAISPQLDLVEATLYLEIRRDSWQPNIMSPATQPGHFTHKVFDIRDTLRYYARAGDVKTGSFELAVPTEAELSRREKLRKEAA